MSAQGGKRIAWRALLSGLVFATIWSLSFIFIRSALTDIQPLWLVASRLALAGGLLLLFQGRPILRFLSGLPTRTLLRVAVAGILSQTVYLGGCCWVLLYLPSSIVNIVVSSLPLMTLLFSRLLLHEQIGVRGVVAFILSMVGVTVTLGGGGLAAGAKLGNAGGASVLLIAAVIALAFGNVLMKPIISRASLVPFCALQCITGGLVAALVAQINEPGLLPSGHAILHAGLSLAFLAIVSSILGTLLWFQLLQAMPANAASSFFLLTPVIGIALGAFVFDEPVTLPKIAGILILSSAIGLRLKELPIFEG